MSLLKVENLTVEFPLRSGLLGLKKTGFKAVADMTFTIKSGETLGVVGESGSGKTTLGRAILRLVEPARGSIGFEGNELRNLGPRELRAMRRKLQMIFQDPYSSLDPRLRIEDAIGEALDIHRLTPTRKARHARVAELLQAVGMQPEDAARYPHEFSGGQRQRIGIARALAVEPRLIVCDEVVSALDVSVQAQVLKLLAALQEQRGLAYLFISHDLAVVEQISHRILVMYLGRIMELGPTPNVCSAPRHPYTQALIDALPTLDRPRRAQRPKPALGERPTARPHDLGCPFYTRCPKAEDRCLTATPELRAVAPDHFVACHLTPALGDATAAIPGNPREELQ